MLLEEVRGLGASERAQQAFPIGLTQEGNAAAFLKLEEQPTADDVWERLRVYRCYPTRGRKRGATVYAEHCAACHGPEAKGNPTLGAPDLTDDYWLYGRDRAIIREGLDKGRNGAMPAHKPLIGETPARLAAAYVWSLSHGSSSP